LRVMLETERGKGEYEGGPVTEIGKSGVRAKKGNVVEAGGIRKAESILFN